MQAAGPAVLVLPFEALSGGEGGQLLASGLTGGLIADLMRFDGLQVFAGGPAGQRGSDLPPAAAGALAYVISGDVQRELSRTLVTARLTDRGTGQVLWSQTYQRALTTAEIYDVQAELSAGIVGRLAQVYGVITAAATTQLRRTRPETLFAYDCVQRAFAYRRTASMETYPAVRACLEEAVRRDPGYAIAWAMLAFAHLDAARFGLVEPAARAGELQAGLAAAQHAVELAPDSVPALQSLSALRYGNGDYVESERIQRQAIALNPNNPESLAQLGWRLTKRGGWQEGAALLQQAIDRSVAVPNWYHTALALGLYLGGELERARDSAEAGQAFCCGLGHAVLAVTEAAVGDLAEAGTALDEAMRQAPLLGRDPRAFWAGFQVSNDLIDRLDADLAKAGLVAPSSTTLSAAPRS
jgi:TolB-like protein